MVPYLGPDLHYEGFRGWPHELLIYSRADEESNHSLSLRYATEIQFWGSQEWHWHTGASSVESHWDGLGRSTHDWRGAETAGLAQSQEGMACRGGSNSRSEANAIKNIRESGFSQLCLVDRWETVGISWGKRHSELWTFPHREPLGLGADDLEAVCSPSWEQGEFSPNWICSKPSAVWSDLRAGGWPRNLLSSLPTWLFLWSYDLLSFSQTVCLRQQMTISPNLF